MERGGEAPWYRLLDHTGDLGFLVRAASLGGLYDAAARALFDCMLDVSSVRETSSERVEVIDAVDREDLLVRFLSELLFLHDARGWLFRGADVERLDEQSVLARARGERFDASRHLVQRQVKAVTYHQLLLAEDNDGWSARVILDL